MLELVPFPFCYYSRELYRASGDLGAAVLPSRKKEIGADLAFFHGLDNFVELVGEEKGVMRLGFMFNDAAKHVAKNRLMYQILAAHMQDTGFQATRQERKTIWIEAHNNPLFCKITFLKKQLL